MRFAYLPTCLGPLSLGLISLVSACSSEADPNPFATSVGPTTEIPGEDEGLDTSGEGDGDGEPDSCGDGVVDPGEQCDLGPQNAADGQCTPDCTIAACGDGYLYSDFEECDDGNTVDTDACVGNCELAVCGDGYVQAGVEDCDDGNDDDADGCTSSCTPGICGDGIEQAGEQCDDGNTDTTDACPACQLAFCGDGYIQADVETCDDGNTESNDACTSPFCEPAACGDGIVWEGMEACDDGNDVDGDACTNACTVAVCGDGIVQDGVEECDDGNANDDDGCDSQCVALADPQCFLPYNQFTMANRNRNQVGGGRFCDQSLGNEWQGPGWYRFTGASGTQLADSVVPSNQCATHASGWLNGAHPSFADGIVDRQVCFNWSGNQCNWNANIQVVACPGFYLYNLVNTPACQLRYCGQD